MTADGDSVKKLREAAWHYRQGGFRQLCEWNRRRSESRVSAPPRSATGANAVWQGAGKRRRLGFADASLIESTVRRRDLKVGVVLDDFSHEAFHYEWNIFNLDPGNWEEQCVRERPDLIFVESAWAGSNGLWKGKLAGPYGASTEYHRMLAWCRDRGVPSVFWNKEDPPHYSDFIDAARGADWVYTTDSDLLGIYYSDLGHKRVGVLPFAAQPAIHNPVRPEEGWHSRDVAFAGMYFSHRYPERREQMNMLLGGAVDASANMDIGLEIFSRQLGGRPEYQFPAPFSSHVVGSLTYQQMLTAYKAYKVFLNVNSVTESPSMCARRVFEITASGSPVISTYSRALGEYFTDKEIPTAENQVSARQLVSAFVKNSELNDRTTHIGQRKIWKNHTYSHRAEQVILDVLPVRHEPVCLPTVSALVSTIRPKQVEEVLRLLGSQLDVEVQVILLTHGFELELSKVLKMAETYGVKEVRLLNASRRTALGECLNMCVQAATGHIVTKMDDDDYYGPNYLSDQLYALRYSGADIVGKQAHYMYLADYDATISRFSKREHKFTNFVMGPTIMGRREVFLETPFENVHRGEDSLFLKAALSRGLKIYSSDRFNYYQVRNSSGHTWSVSTKELLEKSKVEFFGRPESHVSF